jgi:hypothetical protein
MSCRFTLYKDFWKLVNKCVCSRNKPHGMQNLKYFIYVTEIAPDLCGGFKLIIRVFVSSVSTRAVRKFIVSAAELAAVNQTCEFHRVH